MQGGRSGCLPYPAIPPHPITAWCKVVEPGAHPTRPSPLTPSLTPLHTAPHLSTTGHPSSLCSKPYALRVTASHTPNPERHSDRPPPCPALHILYHRLPKSSSLTTACSNTATRRAASGSKPRHWRAALSFNWYVRGGGLGESQGMSAWMEGAGVTGALSYRGYMDYLLRGLQASRPLAQPSLP